MKVDDSFLYVGQQIFTNMESVINKKSNLVTLLEIKNLIEMSSFRMQNYDDGSSMTKLHTGMEDLNKKFDDLKDVVIGIKKRGDSPRKIAMKNINGNRLHIQNNTLSGSLGLPFTLLLVFAPFPLTPMPRL